MALNGAAGAVVAPTVSAAVPVLVTWTLSVALVPLGRLAKATVPGEAARPGLVPLPCSESRKLPVEVVTVSCPLAPPAALGVNETGIASC